MMKKTTMKGMKTTAAKMKAGKAGIPGKPGLKAMSMGKNSVFPAKAFAKKGK